MAKLPAYLKHKASGQAYVFCEGHQVYLGGHGTDESQDAYSRFLVEWRAAGSRLPEHYRAQGLTVAGLIVAYAAETASWRLSHETRERTRRALRTLRQLYGDIPAAELRARHLVAARQVWLEHGANEKMLDEEGTPASRTTANTYAAAVKGLLRWGAETGRIPESTYAAVAVVRNLLSGRTTAADPVDVHPVSRAAVDAALAFLPGPVRGLVELQWHTGARPGELLRLRPADVDTRGDVWTVDLGHGHKTGHRGKQRIIYLGPQAQAVLRPFLLRPSDATCFDPREAVREALAKPGNPNTKGRRPKPRQSDRVIQDAYTTASYRRAIARACVKAGIEAWHPHQLRHAAATRFREAYGLEAAQALLGHATLQATQVYAERTHAAAIEAARGM